MSFWPFGPHSPRKSNIDCILNDYLKVLKRQDKHTLMLLPEESSSISSINECNEEDDQTIPVLKETSEKNETVKTETPMSVNKNGGNISIENQKSTDDYSYDLAKISSLKIDDIMANRTLAIQTSNEKKLDSVLSTSRSSISSLLLFTSNDSTNKLDRDSINGLRMLPNLNHNFIDRILKEESLIDELSIPNNKLIDFLCLGYFYDEHTGDRILHIDYLIDILLTCLDEIDEITISLSESKNVDHFEIVEADEDCISRFQCLPKKSYTEVFHDESSTAEKNSICPALSLVTYISDILSHESVWLITELLVKSKERMTKLWSILGHKGCQNERSPHLSIFLKIQESLLISRQTDYLNFIRHLPTLVDDILKHNNIPILFDFLLKLISTDKPELPTGIIDTVFDQNLIPKCLKHFNNEMYSVSIQTCITDFLKMLVEISSNIPMDDLNIGPNKLSRQLCSMNIVESLVHIILDQRGVALCNIVTIIIELIRKNNSDYDRLYSERLGLDTERVVSSRDPLYLGYLLRAFTLRLPEMVDILKQNFINSTKYVETRNDTSYTPVGMINLRILELIAELIHCSNMSSLNLHVFKDFSMKINEERSQIENRLLESQRDDITLQRPPNTKEVAHVKLLPYDRLTVVNFEETDKSPCIINISKSLNDTLRENATIGNSFKIQLYDQHILPDLISMILECPWNNMFHNVIFDIVQQILNGRSDSLSYNCFLIYSILVPTKATNYTPVVSGPPISSLEESRSVVHTIIEGYERSYTYYEKNHTDLGYMGHLAIIAEEVLKFSQQHDISSISWDIVEVLISERWKYVADVLLSDTRMLYGQILGGGSYANDGQGNLIPQIPISTRSLFEDDEEEENSPGKVKNTSNEILYSADEYEEQYRILKDMMTEFHIHEKTKYLFNLAK